MTQTRNIVNEKGKININYIGKFETLEEDLIQILKNIGIKNMIHDSNKKMNKRDHLEFYNYYDEDTLQKVNILLKEDFQYLPYKKYDTIQEFKQIYCNHYFLEDSAQSPHSEEAIEDQE
jgi:hypothetical protein